MRARSSQTVLLAASVLLGSCGSQPRIDTVVRPASSSPLVAIRLLVRAGSAHDPPGKEGTAALTGLMLARAATKLRTYPEILDDLYPTASSIEVRTDREVTLFETVVHLDHLDILTDLLVESLTRPAFGDEDFERNRDQLLAELDTVLRTDDELLGLELLQQTIFSGHPYGHAPAGTSESVAALEIEDVRTFFDQHYTRDRMLLGVGGGAPDGYAEQLQRRLAKLPSGGAPDALPPAPELIGRHLTLVRKATSGVGIHLGFPLAVTRTDEDYVPLLVATTILGDHRTFHGRLIEELRIARGLNYGDYAYVEYFHDPPETSSPTPNVPRRHQYFSIWLRPVAPQLAPFALRAAVYELERLIEEGVSEDEVETTRTYLRHRSKLWALDGSSQVGFALDSRYYDMPPFLEDLDRRLERLSATEVNDAIRVHLQSTNLQIVFVGGDTDALRDTLATEQAPLPEYPSPSSDSRRATDRDIASLSLDLTSIREISVDELFSVPAL